jgi:hypothetical protein
MHFAKKKTKRKEAGWMAHNHRSTTRHAPIAHCTPHMEAAGLVSL